MTANQPADDEPIEIVQYHASWPARFAAEKALLEQAIGMFLTGGIHHVGSTAVPGLAAKPVIDILVGVEDLRSSRACFAQLAELGYQYAPYRTDEMHWFCKPEPSRRTHHLHLVPTRSSRFRAELAFRERLRADSELADQYGALKRTLSSRYRNDREGYTQAKGDFIERVIHESEVEEIARRLT